MRAKKPPDPWRSAISSLMNVERAVNDASRLVTTAPLRRGIRRYVQPTTPRPSLKVSIVERLTHCTASICWHDATACSYVDQVWREGVARQSGVCALTGHGILPGDAIYRPINTAGTPLNHGAMILARCVEDYELDQGDAYLHAVV